MNNITNYVLQLLSIVRKKFIECDQHEQKYMSFLAETNKATKNYDNYVDSMWYKYIDLQINLLIPFYELLTYVERTDQNNQIDQDVKVYCLKLKDKIIQTKIFMIYGTPQKTYKQIEKYYLLLDKHIIKYIVDVYFEIYTLKIKKIYDLNLQQEMMSNIDYIYEYTSITFDCYCLKVLFDILNQSAEKEKYHDYRLIQIKALYVLVPSSTKKN